MIVKQYIKDFEKLGFGMFCHFGIYSVWGRGEWSQEQYPDYDYESLADKFNPTPDFAEELVKTAKSAGCKYITLTTRHHDGFALFDTKGLSDFDAVSRGPHRDLVREFVDACRRHGIVPFFYHTIIDWHNEYFKNDDMKEYLKYLRANIELLCKNYGKIGGFWFDGMWGKKIDWEEDALYSLIRKYQPEAMIINNTGLSKLGQTGHIELDSVTFERGKPFPINLEGAPKYLASEMCQVLNVHWGYAKYDFNYFSMKNLIEDLCLCRKCGSNFLLNLGPTADGTVRPIDKAFFDMLGEWVEIHKEAIYTPRPSGIEVSRDKDFIQSEGDVLYYFAHSLGMSGNKNVAPGELDGYESSFKLSRKIKSITYIDNGAPVDFTQDGEDVKLLLKPQRYGFDLVVKVAKIEF